MAQPKVVLGCFRAWQPLREFMHRLSYCHLKITNKPFAGYRPS